MFTFRATLGSGRRTLRATPLGLVLLGALSVGLGASWLGAPTNQLVLLGYGSSGPLLALARTSSPAVSTTKTKGSFGISGSAVGLYPGHTTPLVLIVTNPQAFRIVVSSITTTVGDASATCLASNLTVSSFSGHLRVPAHGSAQASVGASLVPSAPDACNGATFPLIYSGRGRRH